MVASLLCNFLPYHPSERAIRILTFPCYLLCFLFCGLFSLPLCLVLCLTGPELFPWSQERPVRTYNPVHRIAFQQDTCLLSASLERTCRTWNYTSPSLKQQKLEKLPKIVHLAKHQTSLSYSLLLKAKFCLRMLRRVFHFVMMHSEPCIHSML